MCSTPCARHPCRTCRTTSPAGSRSARRVTRRMATWRPTPLWTAPPSPRASRPAKKLRRCPGGRLARRDPASPRPPPPGPALRQSPARPGHAFRALLPQILRGRREAAWRQQHRCRHAHQRRIRLRQPDRPDAYWPCCRASMPCVGDSARQPAGQGRLRRHQGVFTSTTCRRAGHRARLGGLLALPASHPAPPLSEEELLQRSPRRPAIPRRIPDPGRRATLAAIHVRLGSRCRRTSASPRRRSGSTSCATSPSNAMLQEIREDLATLGVTQGRVQLRDAPWWRQRRADTA